MLCENYKKAKDFILNMANVTLEQINTNILDLKKEFGELKELLKETNLELADEVKTQIQESRKRQVSQFKTQKEIEKKFL